MYLKAICMISVQNNNILETLTDVCNIRWMHGIEGRACFWPPPCFWIQIHSAVWTTVPQLTYNLISNTWLLVTIRIHSVHLISHLMQYEKAIPPCFWINSKAQSKDALLQVRYIEPWKSRPLSLYIVSAMDLFTVPHPSLCGHLHCKW